MTTVLDQIETSLKVTPIRTQCRACLHWVAEPLVDDVCGFCESQMVSCANCQRLNATDEKDCVFCGEPFPAPDEDLQGEFWTRVDASRELDRDGISES